MSARRWADVGVLGIVLGAAVVVGFSQAGDIRRMVAPPQAAPPLRETPRLVPTPPSAATPSSTPRPSGAPGSLRTTSIQAQPTAPVSDGVRLAALRIPVAGVSASQLRDTYGDARGTSRRHGAIDIMAPRGTPVIAAASGVAAKLDNGPRGGIALYVLGEDRRTIYYYAHLDRFATGIAQGVRVTAGDTIGYVGDTGNAGAGNFHLHFEVTTTADPARYWGGVPTNPYLLLKRAAARPDPDTSSAR